MDIGVFIFPTEDGIPVPDLAKLAEDRGFDSLFLPEHTHIPAIRESDYPAGGALPAYYAHTPDPFITLATAAAATTKIKLGLGVCLVNQRDPIVTAKEVATLDRVSNGRVLFGVGAGWNVEEMSHHGVDPKTRFSSMRERVEAMKAIWTQEEASYDGRFVSFDRIWCWPKPVQQPHPPVLVGGNGERVLKRVIRWGDEWYPNRFGTDDEMLARVAELQRMAEDAGRPPIPVTINGIPSDPARIERWGEGGVTRCIVRVPPEADAGEAERLLDQLIERVGQLA
jgi:probable F420-dependent oxidoreductase